MGRTKRKRKRQNRNDKNISLDSNPEIISLRKWMFELKWNNNQRLKLRDFDTGRGVSSDKQININETLIEIPYDMMITYTVLSRSEIPSLLTGEKFKMQDMLALFLIIERHKGVKSKWKHYINSLPEEIPALPWLCTDDEIESISLEFRREIRKRRWGLEMSWERVKKSINSKSTCLCCKKPLDRVLTMNSFTWGYVMVNTRAVYVDPDTVLGLSSKDLITYLSDEPCLALCPFLDMFNHSDFANTNANLLQEGTSWKYTLTTFNYHKKYDQIFISYGAHDNIKLLCEYGFFLLNNSLDSVMFEMQDLIMGVNLTEKQYKYIHRYFESNLSVSLNGLSFHLKAVLYVLFNAHKHDWNVVTFSECYTRRDMDLMYDFIKELLIKKLDLCNKDLGTLEQKCIKSRYLVNVINYFKYRVNFINRLLIFIDEELKHE